MRVRQGNTFAVNERLAEITGGDFNPAKLSEAAMSLRSEEGINHFELDLSARQAMFQLMASGVFDRHPSLKLVLTELRADWVPETLGLLDALVEESSLDIQRKPSEYWSTNCFVTPSSIRPTEVELRHEIGVDRLMFGRDYPHPEGTWPNTHDWVRATLTGLEEEESERSWARTPSSASASTAHRLHGSRRGSSPVSPIWSARDRWPRRRSTISTPDPGTASRQSPWIRLRSAACWRRTSPPSMGSEPSM